MIGAGEALEFGRESGRGQGASGENSDVGRFLVKLRDLFADDGYARILLDESGYFGRKLCAVDCEGVSGGNRRGVGCGEEEGVGSAHLLLEQPGSGVFRLGLQRVGADEFGEVGGLMSLGGASRAHLVESDLAAESSGLESGFRTRQSAANDSDLSDCHGPPPPYLIAQSLGKGDFRPVLERKWNAKARFYRGRFAQSILYTLLNFARPPQNGPYFRPCPLLLLYRVRQAFRGIAVA